MANRTKYSCDVCSYSTVWKENLPKHKYTHSGLKPYQCDECAKKFRCPSTFRRHKDIHNSEKKYKCKRCDYAARQQQALLKHLFRHHQEKLFGCDYCDYKTNYRHDFTSHILTHKGEKPSHQTSDYDTSGANGIRSSSKNVHSNETPYHCEMCDFKSKYKQELSIHMYGHSEQRDFKYEHKPELLNPICNNSELKPYKCVECDYCTDEKSAFDEHKKLHSPEIIYQCDRCTFTTTNSVTCYFHKKTHINMRKKMIEKLFQCHLCDHKTNNIIQLNSHLLDHENAKSYDCKECEYKTSDANGLKSHIQRLHSNETTYHCNLCNFASTCKCEQTLINHISTHSEPKVYKCNDCDYCADEKAIFDEHTKMHLSELLYRCNRCTFTTTNCITFYFHKKTHVNVRKRSIDKLLKCNLCDYKANNITELNAHILNHKNEKNYDYKELDYKAPNTNELGSPTAMVLSNETSDCQLESDSKQLLVNNVYDSEKPFKCSECDYSTHVQSIYDRHKKLHLFEIFFNCDKCTFTTTDSDTFTFHKKTHNTMKKRKLMDLGSGIGKKEQPSKNCIKPQLETNMSLLMSQFPNPSYQYNPTGNFQLNTDVMQLSAKMVEEINGIENTLVPEYLCQAMKDEYL